MNKSCSQFKIKIVEQIETWKQMKEKPEFMKYFPSIEESHLPDLLFM